MNEEQKLKLARAKAKSREGVSLELSFDNVALTGLHDQMATVQETIAELLDKDPNVTTNQRLTEVNDGLVKLLAAFTANGRLINKSLDDANTAKAELTQTIVKAMTELVSKLPQPKDLPAWLKSPQIIDNVRDDLKEMGGKLDGLAEVLKQGQKPEDFVPFRRVKKAGNRLEFDDSTWGGSGGGGAIPHNSWSASAVIAQKATATRISSASGAFGGYMIYNPNAAAIYLQIFDSTASPNVGTDGSLPFGIPAGASANVEFTNGIKINRAIWVACTTTATGSSAPVTGVDMTILYE